RHQGGGGAGALAAAPAPPHPGRRRRRLLAAQPRRGDGGAGGLEPGARAAPRRGGLGVAAGGRHRHHEHHAGVGHRAHARDRPAHGGGRAHARHPRPVPGRGGHALAHRRPGGGFIGCWYFHDDRGARGLAHPHLARGGGARGRVRLRDRGVLRLLPGAQGRAPESGRSIALRMSNPRRELFLVSFLILFFELAAIRWFGATVLFLTFFTNIVLLACFLGMSVGLLAARRPAALVRLTLPAAMLALLAAIATHMLYWAWADSVTISLGSQQASPRVIYFGTEYRPADPSRWVVPMWAIAGAFFALIAAAFVGLGQVMGRAFDAIPNRVAAYSVDVAGSLTGIAAFAAASYFEVPASVWFVPIVLLALYFAGWRRQVQGVVALATLALAAIAAHGLPSFAAEIRWSPYYKVTYWRETGTIHANNLNHQSMIPIGALGPIYLLPHLLNRDAGGTPFDDVLIIGAGSGNDVAAALRAGAKRVDAVEIDPVIQSIGQRAHPDHPYADPRVSVHLDDGRSFARRTDATYDLAVYALVDSLVLHSGFSSLRLENFLFTREAFADVKRRLKNDGVFVMYNFYRQGWVIGRLAAMAEETFGAPPVVISLPFSEAIREGDSQ